FDASERPADLGVVVVEDGSDRDAVLGEDRRARNRLAEPPGADERDVVLPLRAEDLADLGQQRVDRVADAALAELAERREITPNLGGVDVRVLGDLLRGDPVLPHLPRLCEDLEIAAQPRCNTYRQPLRQLDSSSFRVANAGDCACRYPIPAGRTVRRGAPAA